MKATLLFCLALGLFSCAAPEILCPNNEPNQIIFNDPEPDIYLSSIDSMHDTLLLGGPCEYPWPLVSTADTFLDMDNNGSNDFRIYVGHGPSIYQSASSPNWCNEFDQIILISGETPQNEIISISHSFLYNGDYMNYYTTEFLPLSDPIKSPEHHWKNSVFISVNYEYIYSHTPIGTYYLGVRLGSEPVAKYGWIEIEIQNAYTILIKSYALNNTWNNCMNVGEQ